jgi:hypothetical protein
MQRFFSRADRTVRSGIILKDFPGTEIILGQPLEKFFLESGPEVPVYRHQRGTRDGRTRHVRMWCRFSQSTAILLEDDHT